MICIHFLKVTIASLAYIPAASHFFVSRLLLVPCRHAGKLLSSCVCLFCMWFSIDIHLATLSGPLLDDAAVQ